MNNTRFGIFRDNVPFALDLLNFKFWNLETFIRTSVFRALDTWSSDLQVFNSEDAHSERHLVFRSSSLQLRGRSFRAFSLRSLQNMRRVSVFRGWDRSSELLVSESLDNVSRRAACVDS